MQARPSEPDRKLRANVKQRLVDTLDSFSLSSDSISFSTLNSTTGTEADGKQRLVDTLVACGWHAPGAVEFAADVGTLQELVDKARQQDGPAPKGVTKAGDLSWWRDLALALQRCQWVERLVQRWPQVDKGLHEQLVAPICSSTEFERKYQQMQLDDAKFFNVFPYACVCVYICMCVRVNCVLCSGKGVCVDSYVQVEV